MKKNEIGPVVSEEKFFENSDIKRMSDFLAWVT